MEDKDMVLDVLNQLNSNILNYSEIISKSNNIKLREKFKKLRTNQEDFQLELQNLAFERGYITQVDFSSDSHIIDVKSKLTELVTMQQGAGPIPNMN